MKTIQKPKNSSIFSMLLLLCLLTNKCFSQSKPSTNRRIGMSIGTQLSGNRHGTLYEGSVNLSNDKNIISIGALIQKRKNKVCGLSLSYTKPIFDGSNFEESNKGLQLFFYSKLQYINKASLSFNGESLEDRYYTQSNDAVVDFKNYKTSTIEVMGGFGLNLKIFKNIVWTNSVGFGVYDHINYLPGMYCDKMGPTLVLSTSLKLMNFIK